MTATPSRVERPVRSRMPGSLADWVARISLVSPDEQSGALPCHDTTPQAAIDWTFTPSRPPTHTFPATANNHAANQRVSATVIDTTELPPPRLWVPWSPIMAAAGTWAVYGATRLVDPPGLVALVVMVAVVVCGLLLVAAQTMTTWTTNGRRR